MAETALQFAAWIIVLGGPLVAAGAASGALGFRGAPRWVATGVFWAMLLVAVFRWTADFGFFRIGIGVAAMSIVGGAGAWSAARSGRGLFDTHALARWSTWAREQGLGPLTAFAALAVSIFAMRALAMPPLAWDSLVHHLFQAAVWVQSGSHLAIDAPEGWDGYATLPDFGSTLAAWWLLPFNGDTLVNLLHFPTFAFVAIATYALGRELGLDRAWGTLAALSLPTAPMVLSYLTTAYADPFVLWFLMSACLFLARYDRTSAPRDGLLAFAAAALAIGTKPTALLPAAILSLALTAVSLRPGGAGLRVPVFGALLLALGGEQYLWNAWVVGNPFYPVGLDVLGLELPGSRFAELTLAAWGLGSPQDDWKAIWVLFRPTLEWPRGAGPRFALYAVAAAASLPWWWSRRRERRITLLTLVAIAVLPILFFYRDETVTVVMSRRFWPVSSARFHAPSLGIAMVLAFGWLQAVTRGRRWPLLALALLVVPDVAIANFALLHPTRTLPLLAVALAGGSAIFVAWRRGVATGIALLLSFAGATLWLHSVETYRRATRIEHFERHVDLHPFQSHLVPSFAWVEAQPEPRVIALAVGFDGSGHNWFFYPLLGADYRHRVVYAPAHRPVPAPSWLDRGRPPAGNSKTWIANLQSLGVDTVVFHWTSPRQPEELAWAAEHPELFRGVARGHGYLIARFDDAER